MAKQLSTDEVNLRVVVDGSPARRELATLDQAMVKTRDRVKELVAENDRLAKDMKAMPKGSDEFKRAAAAVEANRKELVTLRAELSNGSTRAAELRKEIGLSALSLRELRNEAARLRVLRDTASSGGQAFQQLDHQLTEVNARIKELTNETLKSQKAWERERQGVQLTSMSLEQLEKEAARVKTALYSMSPKDARFNSLRKELQGVEAQMESVRSGLGPFGKAWAGVRSQVMGAGAVLGTFFAGGAILSGIKGLVTGSAKLSDAEADVMRTTGLTKAGFDGLNKSLSALSTRTPRSELLALASDAGKLGISGEQNVLGFVRAADQIKVSLGDDLGEDAIKQIGKLNQTFKVAEQRGLGLEDSMLKTGSAINTLGQSSTAAESFLVDYTSRQAGVNAQSKISIENTLGWAAAIDQLNLQAETSSTAMSQFTLKAFKEPATYAKIAGMSVKDFNKLLATDTNEALLRTLEGLNGNNAGMQEMVAKFGDLEQDGGRAVSVLASLASQTKMVREQQKIANQAFKDGTSITTEFNVKNTNLAANLEIIGKKMYGWFVNGAMVKGINSIAKAFADWVKVPLSDTLEEERLKMNALYYQILQTNEGTSTRRALITELKQMAPQYLGDLNAEKTTNEQLAVAMEKLNRQLINKIVIQRQQEKIDKLRETAADAQLEAYDKEQEALKLLGQLETKYGLDVQASTKGAKNSLEQLTMYRSALIKGIQAKGGSGLFPESAELANAILSLGGLKGYYEQRNRIALDAEQEKQKMLEQFGLNNEPTEGPATKEEPAPAPIEDNSKEHQKALKAMQDLREDLQKLRRDMDNDTLSADEREIAQLDDKFAEIRKKTLENATHTAADLQAIDEAHEQSRANLLEHQADERAKKAAERAAKAREDMAKAEDVFWESKLSESDRAIVEEMKRLDELTALYEAAGYDTQDIVKRSEEAIAAIRKKFRDKEKKEALEARKAAIQERIAVYNGVASALGGVNNLLQASYEAAGKQNYEQTATARTLGLMQIAIATAVGVAEAIKAGAGVPWPANIGAIASGVGAVLSGVASAIALLNSKAADPSHASTAAPPSQPTLNDVPIGADGLVLDGPSHRDKGMSVFNNATGEQAAELEGGELVMSKRFTDANADQLPKLLAASKAGKRLNFITNPPERINVEAYQSAMRIVHMADGGVVPSARSEQSSPEEGEQPSSSDSALLLRLCEGQERLLAEMKENTAAAMSPRDSVVKLNPEFDRALDTWDRLKARNTYGRRSA